MVASSNSYKSTPPLVSDNYGYAAGTQLAHQNFYESQSTTSQASSYAKLMAQSQAVRTSDITTSKPKSQRGGHSVYSPYPSRGNKIESDGAIINKRTVTT